MASINRRDARALPIGAVGGFAAMGVGLGSIYANNEGGGVCLPCIGYFGAIGAGIGAGIGALVDLAK